MIKAIVFDCFGVLVGERWKAFLHEHFGTAGERHEWANAQMQLVSRGEMSHEKLAEIMSHETGVTAEEFIAVLHTNPLNAELFAFIETLKPAYKIGFLSNVGMNRMEALFTAHQIALFDAITLSYEIKIAKPDVGAYEAVAAQLGVPVEACVMVDDTKAYCDGAETAGMTAVLYTDYSTFRQKIEALL